MKYLEYLDVNRYALLIAWVFGIGYNTFVLKYFYDIGNQFGFVEFLSDKYIFILLQGGFLMVFVAVIIITIFYIYNKRVKK